MELDNPRGDILGSGAAGIAATLTSRPWTATGKRRFMRKPTDASGIEKDSGSEESAQASAAGMIQAATQDIELALEQVKDAAQAAIGKVREAVPRRIARKEPAARPRKPGAGKTSARTAKSAPAKSAPKKTAAKKAVAKSRKRSTTARPKRRRR